ncbi:MAG: Fic family protein [Candidatus Aenigmarchaeota archaeon]|nr:Fic family protein [Candidatus Aenigmarchaeota archaeon]
MGMKKAIIIALFALLLIPLVSSTNLNQLKVTLEHPFLVNGEWVPARELVVGDILKTYDGKEVMITGIRTVNEPVLVYNFEDSLNNYIVDGLVVHNSNLIGSQNLFRTNAFRGRRFIDKNHYFKALTEGKYYNGQYNPILKQKPWLTYSLEDWNKWTAADDFLYTKLKTLKGKITKELILEVGDFFGMYGFKTRGNMMGGYFHDGTTQVFLKSDIEAAGKNPYLTVENSGTLADPGNSDTLNNILGKLTDPVEIANLQQNPGDFVVGWITYPKPEEVEPMLESIIDAYNFFFGACSRSDLIRLASDFQRDFVSIHPFNDNNGRISRLLMDYILQSRGFSPAHLEDTTIDVFSTQKEWAKQVGEGVRRATRNVAHTFPID